jgi:hypothetical protein
MAAANKGKVYFVSAPGRIKIGFTLNPDSRLEKLRQVDMEHLTVVAIVDGTRRLERHLHRKLASYRVKGEWFLDCVAVRNAINDCSAFNDAEDAMRRPGSSLDEARFVSEAATLCEKLLILERAKGTSNARATSLVAIKTGISHGRIWQLQYRTPKSVTAAEIFALREITGPDCDVVHEAKAMAGEGE